MWPITENRGTSGSEKQRGGQGFKNNHQRRPMMTMRSLLIKGKEKMHWDHLSGKSESSSRPQGVASHPGIKESVFGGGGDMIRYGRKSVTEMR